jgi:4-azaleucine resistance transporter AzlC
LAPIVSIETRCAQHKNAPIVDFSILFACTLFHHKHSCSLRLPGPLAGAKSAGPLLRKSHMVTPPSTAEASEHDQAAWRAALKTGMPTLFGIVAWGLVVGIAMVKTGLSVPQSLAMTLLVFAGSAQLASLPLIAAQAPVWIIFITALVVNLRFVIFSALLAPHFTHLPWRKRFFLGYVAGDMTVALFLQRYPSHALDAGKLSYLKGLLYPNWLAWQAGSIAGIFLGSTVPLEWGLGFAGTLAIICIAVPMVQSRAGLCGVLVASVTAVLGAGLPYKLGLLVAVIFGMISAMAVEEGSEQWAARRAEKQAAKKPGVKDGGSDE